MPHRSRLRHAISARKPLTREERHALPKGVKLLALSRTVRWIGWGFGENLIPILILSFSASYAEAGLFSSIYEIVLLFALPLVGMLADRASARLIVVLGLILYPLVGFGYFLAGVTGLAAFVVFARAANGITWAMDDIGIDTYYRRTAGRAHLASSFGFIESLAHVGWIATAVVSIWLARSVPVHVLLLGMVPFSLLAIPFVLKAPKDKPARQGVRLSALASYRHALTEWRRWDGKLRLLGGLAFFMGVLSTMVGLFIPIDAYVSGADLSMVIILGIVGSLPCLLAYPIGRFADGHDKYRLIAYGLLAGAVVSAALATVPGFGIKLAAAFLFGTLTETFAVAGKYLVTVLGPEETYGARGSAYESLNTLGNIVAPLLLGVLFDAIGFPGVATVVAAMALALSFSFGLLGSRR